MPMWGLNGSRNMVSSERGLPATFSTGEEDPTSQPANLNKATNLKWITQLGSHCFGNPTIAGGRVYVGTNNDPGMVESRKSDYGVVLCLDEQTGKLLWQLMSPKLRAGDVNDFEQSGNCSPATVENDRVYLVTSRCEVVCLDAKGLANGNDGDFKNEAQYIVGPGEPPVELLPTDADILWIYDMRDELGVFPNQMTASSVLIVGERLYVTTSNGRDWSGTHIPSPNSPSLICMDKNTGKLLGEERSGISTRMFKCNWSSPAYAVIGGKPMVFFGGDDGFCYAFDPVPVDGVLKEIWRSDCNPPEYRQVKFGQSKGPSGIVATPVIHEDRVYIAIGQDPGHGEGAGAQVCLEAATGKLVWMNKEVGRSLSTVAVADGLLYTAELGGKVYCLDAKTGAEIWKHDAVGTTWGSPLLADGKVYIGTENSTLWVLAAGREKKVLGDLTVNGSIASSAVAANGTLYVMTSRVLYAAKQK